MASLVSDIQKTATAQIFENIFDTWSRTIVIYKEPIRTQVVPQDPNAIFGFGGMQNTDLFTYTPVTGIFQAMIKYQSKYGSMGGDDLFQGELNTYISDAPVSIKVRKDCSDFILNNKTERIDVDNLSYILKVATPNPQVFWNTEYYIYDLERKM